MILVPLLNPKFATVPAAIWCELRVRGTSACPGEVAIGWPTRTRAKCMLRMSPRAPRSDCRAADAVESSAPIQRYNVQGGFHAYGSSRRLGRGLGMKASLY